MSKDVNIFWFRRDLRLEDNIGLFNALKDNSNVLPIFIFDKNIIDSLPFKDSRIDFILEKLNILKETLENKYNSSLKIYYKSPIDVFNDLTKEFKVNSVYTNRDYEPYALYRDKEIQNYLNLKSIIFKTFKDQVIFEKNEVTKDNGTPYLVYTPFMKKWKKILSDDNLKSYSIKTVSNNFLVTESFKNYSIEDLNHSESNIRIDNFKLNDHLIANYGDQRDFPALNSTSQIGPHLRFGTISIRKIVKESLKQNDQTFLSELIWREFFMQILWHFPETVSKSFKPIYDNIIWRNNKEDFKKWCDGKTGYPIVDAGMRQLNETGTMHNRVRMVTASFLCKHLLIDWRWGEAYFAEKLNDFELSSNIGNWQWVAGCGVDAAPYFRIFNPEAQTKKFDKDYKYIKKWVKDIETLSYPLPIVDHKYARERCLNTFKKALGKV